MKHFWEAIWYMSHQYLLLKYIPIESLHTLIIHTQTTCTTIHKLAWGREGWAKLKYGEPNKNIARNTPLVE